MSTPTLAFRRQRIAARIREVATRIDADYRYVGELHIIGILPQSYQLVTDLSRVLATYHTVDFVLTHSEPVFPLTRRKNIRNGLRCKTDNRAVLVVTTLLDSDRIAFDTYSEILCESNPINIRMFALLRRRNETVMNPVPNYVGWPVEPNKQYYGYGLEPYSYLPDIYESSINGNWRPDSNRKK